MEVLISLRKRIENTGKGGIIESIPEKTAGTRTQDQWDTCFYKRIVVISRFDGEFLSGFYFL